MQNKGAIRLFAILLALVSMYQLSFTYFSGKVKRDAVEYSQGDKVREYNYLDSISSEGVYNFLWLKDYTFRECQEREINLGLDLKGGINMTLEVSVVDVIKSLSNYSKDTTFLNAIQLAKTMQTNSSDRNFVDLFGEAFGEIDPNAKLAAIFNTVELRDRISFNSTNAQVIDVIKEESESAIKNSFNVIRSRIDRFGVTQPNIQRLENSGRIVVELAGVKDPDRVEKLLEGTALLEFWETYENSEVYQYLENANSKIKEIEEAKRALNQSETKAVAEVVEKQEKVASDEAGTEGLLAELEDTQNADSLALDDDAWKLEYPLFALLQPNTPQGQMGPGATVGFAHFKDTSKINSYLNDPRVSSVFPRDLRLKWSFKPYKYIDDKNHYELIAIKITSRDGMAPLTGDAVVDASKQFGNNQAVAEVDMSMNAEGAKIWAKMTGDNIGRQVAIVLDGYVYSHPTVQGEIPGGRTQITGDFSIAEAEDMANVLKSGKLPAPATVIQSEIVGPTLGHEAVTSGLNSFLIAFVVILFYMVFYYSKRAGFVSDLALVANMFFMMGVLSSFGASLTLPGIAGIVLTIGMSVDANVLIYERIREELAGGKGLAQSIKDGYKNAYSAIIDANVTTLLIGVILFIFGSGPIKGFATTLIIGILTSLFSAIFITRLIFEGQLLRKKKITFSNKITEGWFKNTNIDFIGKRKIFYAISSVLVVLGILSLFTHGLNSGIDFTGGRAYVIRFEQPVVSSDVAELLKSEFGEAPEVKFFGENNQVRLVTKYRVAETGSEIDADINSKLYNGLMPLLGDDVSLEQFLNDYRQSSIKVGPTIADDLKQNSFIAIIVALFFMFLYILVRFRNWQFGLGAVVALVHDSLIILGLFSILDGIVPFSLEVNQAFIAAILTVVGYSINDTVVVFDRIREYVGMYKNRERTEIMNLALNSTLSRTFSTSLSTFVVLLSIFLFGGEVIQGFTFALLLGVVVGTYSSLFIASPVVYDTILRGETTRVLKSKRRS